MTTTATAAKATTRKAQTKATTPGTIEPTLLWLDVETTGLNPKEDGLLAVGMVHTDLELKVLDKLDVCLPILIGDPSLSRMTAQVRAWHTKTGLLDRCREVLPYIYQERLETVSTQIADFLQRVCPAGVEMGDRPRVAGSTVSFDRSWMAERYPEYVSHVHYRSIDVSTLLELSRMYHPDLMEGAPEKRELHLPMEDIQDSQTLFAFLREKLGLGSHPGSVHLETVEPKRPTDRQQAHLSPRTRTAALRGLGSGPDLEPRARTSAHRWLRSPFAARASFE